MTEATSSLTTSSRYHTRREYRHRASDCARLLFVGYLPPGTRIEIRCPSCGRMHVIEVEVDIEQQFV